MALTISVDDKKVRQKKNVRITKWAIFTVVFGVAPLFASWAVGNLPFAEAMFGRGELFLIAAVLTGDAFGRVWNEKATTDVAGTICIGALGLILAFSAFEFGNASKDLLTLKTITPSHIVASITDFFFACVVAFVAVRMEE
jgi:biotin transporter BioY